MMMIFYVSVCVKLTVLSYLCFSELVSSIASSMSPPPSLVKQPNGHTESPPKQCHQTEFSPKQRQQTEPNKQQRNEPTKQASPSTSNTTQQQKKQQAPIVVDGCTNDASADSKSEKVAVVEAKKQISATDAISAIVVPPYPKTKSNVVITYVVNHRTVYIRSLATNDEYLKMLNDVCEYSRLAQPLTKLPDRGSIVLAPFDGIMYRAQVLKIQSNEDDALIGIVFVDFGNKTQCRFSELLDLRPSLQAIIARQIVRVNLANVEAVMTNEGLIDYLTKLEKDNETLQLIYDDTKDLANADVTLINCSTNDNVNDCLRKLNQVIAPTLADKAVFLTDLKCVDVTDSSNVEWLVLNNTTLSENILSCVRVQDNAERLANCKRFQEYCNNLPKGHYTPL